MVPRPPPPEIFAYSVDASLESWDVPPREWLRRHDPRGRFDGLAVSAFVFDAADRVLLVQRAAHDSMPNRWEMPGGAADQEDGPGGSLLRAAARELWEESGLVAERFTHLVPGSESGGDRTGGRTSSPGDTTANSAGASSNSTNGGTVFTNRTGTRVFCRFAFHAVVRSTAPVVLDPDEHQDYVWATEEEVRQQREIGGDGGSDNGRELPMAGAHTQDLILEAFRLRVKDQDVNAQK